MAEDPETQQEGGPRVRGPLAVAGVTLGMLTWPIAFNLGAYGAVLYEDIFQLVVASSILLVITVVSPVYPTPWRWLVWAALAAPLCWLLAAGFVVGSTSEALQRTEFAVALGLIVLVSVPLTLRLLVDVLTPELARSGSRRITRAVVALVLSVGLVGFVVGRQHPRFMTCADFAIAGAFEPENCAR